MNGDCVLYCASQSSLYDIRNSFVLLWFSYRYCFLGNSCLAQNQKQVYTHFFCDMFMSKQIIQQQIHLKIHENHNRRMTVMLLL